MLPQGGYTSIVLFVPSHMQFWDTFFAIKTWIFCHFYENQGGLTSLSQLMRLKLLILSLLWQQPVKCSGSLFSCSAVALCLIPRNLPCAYAVQGSHGPAGSRYSELRPRQFSPLGDFHSLLNPWSQNNLVFSGSANHLRACGLVSTLLGKSM